MKNKFKLLTIFFVIFWGFPGIVMSANVAVDAAIAASTTATLVAQEAQEHAAKHTNLENSLPAKGVIECSSNSKFLGGSFGLRTYVHNECEGIPIPLFFEKYKAQLGATQITGISYFEDVIYIYYN